MAAALLHSPSRRSKRIAIRLDLVVNDGELQVFITFVYKEIIVSLWRVIRLFEISATMLKCLKFWGQVGWQ